MLGSGLFIGLLGFTSAALPVFSAIRRIYGAQHRRDNVNISGPP
jgi:hypothetical protein